MIKRTYEEVKTQIKQVMEDYLREPWLNREEAAMQFTSSKPEGQ